MTLKERERESARESESERERKREREKECPDALSPPPGFCFRCHHATAHNLLRVTLLYLSRHVSFPRLRFGKPLGRGRHCIVQSGYIKGVMQGSEALPCAIKVLGFSQMSEETATLFREHVIRRAALHHSNVVNLIALSWHPKSRMLCLALELAGGGTLRDAIDMPRSGRAASALFLGKTFWTKDQLSAMATDISNGIAYLHKQGAVHGDLSASKVLLTDDLRCLVDLPSREHAALSRTRAFIAPEFVNAEGENVMSDVYSFGVLLLEVSLHTAPKCMLRFMCVCEKCVSMRMARVRV